MAISLEFRCPSCHQIVNSEFESTSELPEIGRTVTCSSCHKEVVVPETSEVVTSTGSRHPLVPNVRKDLSPRSVKSTTSSTPTSSQVPSDYSTLLMLGQINSGLGWVVVVVGILMFFGGMGSGGSFLALSLPGIGVSILGIGVVAFGQTISCFVDTERNTRTISEYSKMSSETMDQILEKMTVLVERGDSEKD